MLIKNILIFFTLSSVILTSSAQAEKNWSITSGKQKATIVELFTSQGCSSCPPAEKVMNTLKDHPQLWKNLIPMAFHVDYWDYIGWQDPFAQKTFSKRQRWHKKIGNVRSVYTPWLGS